MLIIEKVEERAGSEVGKSVDGGSLGRGKEGGIVGRLRGRGAGGRGCGRRVAVVGGKGVVGEEVSVEDVAELGQREIWLLLDRIIDEHDGWEKANNTKDPQILAQTAD